MISINNLTKEYEGTLVLNITDLRIEKGESFGLVGNNGAGKTTLFRLILDLIEATTGEVVVNERPVARQEEWKQVVGSFLDENFLIDFLTPDEFFQFIGKLHGKSESETNDFLESLKDFFNDEILGKKKLIRELSKGNQKKVGIAGALLGEPEILILDEPFTALDPSSQIRLKKLLNELKESKKMTMLISSHDLNHVTEVCERTVVLEKGLIVKDLTTSTDTLKELESYFAI